MTEIGHEQRSPGKATTFQLVFLTYSVICSGAYGLEQMVSAAGPGMATLTLVVLPFLWAIPLALACAELSARHPVEGGYYRWVRLAFGDFAGYQAGWLIWLANLATNATFAVLFANYLRHFVPSLTPLQHWLAALALIWGGTYLNVRGIRIVGTASVVLTVVIFLPFCAMTLLGMAQWQHNPLVPFVPPGQPPAQAFGAGLLIAIWLYSGFEKLTPNAAEVQNPARAFPIALAIAVPMVSLSYIVPTVAALAAHGHWSEWGESYYSVAAAAIGGPALGAAMALGALLSSFCILMVTILGQSRLPIAMAEDELFPAWFKKTHPRFGTPTTSLLLGALALSVLCRFDFAYLAGLFSLVQVFAYLLIYGALFKLRAQPDAGTTSNGFRIPLGSVGLAVLTAPTLLLAILIVGQSIWHDHAFDRTQALVDLLVFASGPITYWMFRRLINRSRQPSLDRSELSGTSSSQRNPSDERPRK